MAVPRAASTQSLMLMMSSSTPHTPRTRLGTSSLEPHGPQTFSRNDSRESRHTAAGRVGKLICSTRHRPPMPLSPIGIHLSVGDTNNSFNQPYCVQAILQLHAPYDADGSITVRGPMLSGPHLAPPFARKSISGCLHGPMAYECTSILGFVLCTCTFTSIRFDPRAHRIADIATWHGHATLTAYIDPSSQHLSLISGPRSLTDRLLHRPLHTKLARRSPNLPLHHPPPSTHTLLI